MSISRQTLTTLRSLFVRRRPSRSRPRTCNRTDEKFTHMRELFTHPSSSERPRTNPPYKLFEWQPTRRNASLYTSAPEATLQRKSSMCIHLIEGNQRRIDCAHKLPAKRGGRHLADLSSWGMQCDLTQSWAKLNLKTSKHQATRVANRLKH